MNPRPSVSVRTWMPAALSSVTFAPMPNRLDRVPRSAQMIRCPVSLSLRSSVAPAW